MIGVVKPKNEKLKPFMASCKRSCNKTGGVLMTENKFENKVKFPLWVNPESLKLVENMYKSDDCKSRSEFIEKAIIFYVGYISTENNEKYLPNILTSTLKSIVKESTERTNRLLFKLSVELAVAMNVIVFANDVNMTDIDSMRGACIKAIKKNNGNYRFEDAMKWQNKA